jgi:hypothetical protein
MENQPMPPASTPLAVNLEYYAKVVTPTKINAVYFTKVALKYSGQKFRH